MIIIAGTLNVHPDDRDALLEAFGPIQAATRAEEAGCLGYSFSADGVLIFERWADAAALEAHFVHPNFGTARAVLGSFRRTGGTVRKYRVDAEDAVAGPDGKVTSVFASV